MTDWNAFQAGSGASFTGQTRLQSYLGGDLDGDFDNDFSDFRLFKSVYVTANGEAAFDGTPGSPRAVDPGIGDDRSPWLGLSGGGSEQQS